MSLARRLAPLMALFLVLILNGCGGSDTPAAGGANSDGVVTQFTPAPFVTSIAVAPARVVISRGGTQQLQVVATYADATRHNVTRLAQWTPAVPQLVSVSPSGLLTALSAGTTTVTVTYRGVQTTLQVLVVEGTLRTLTVSPATASVVAGLNQQYKATAGFSDGQQIDVTDLVKWVSSAPTIATISNGTQSAGLAEGRTAGTATISATYGPLVAQGRLDVTAAQVVSVTVTPPAATVVVGNSARFKATAAFTDGTSSDVSAQATWTTSNAAVATVAQDLATGVAAGTATITAAFGGQSGQATLQVKPGNLVSIAVTPANSTLGVGVDRQYVATGSYDDGSKADITDQVTWTSSNNAIATVSVRGLVKAVSAGTATISATLGLVTGATGLTVTGSPLVSIAISPAANTSIITGTSRAYTAVGTFADGSTGDVTRTVTWSSSNIAVASVSNAAGKEGLVSANRNGLADITATEGAISSTVRARVMLYAYATDGAEVYGYAVDPTSGNLTPVPGPSFPFNSCLCAVAVDPTNRFLWALDGDMNQIYTFDIHDADGALALRIGAVSTGDFPNSIQTTPDGRFMYVTNGADGTVSAYAISASGVLTPVPGSPFQVGTNPTQVAFDPTSRFAYVTDSADNNLSAFTIDPNSGALTRIATYAAGTDALGLVVTPDGRFVYSVSPTDGAIYGFRRSPDGTLAALPGSPFSFGCAPFSLVIDPLGRFLYNQDFSTDAINGWAIDPVTGNLTPTPGQPYDNGGQLPGILALDPAGRFLYSAYLVDPVLAGFGINQTSGALAPLPAGPFPVANPMEYVQLTH